MAGRLFAALIAVPFLAGCGEATEQAINDSFDQEFLTSCISSAQAGLPEELAKAACDCSLDKINEQYSATEKVALTSEQAQPIAEQCFAEVIGQAET